MTAFGQMLRQLREEHELSLTAFATSIHYNKGYLSRIERGLQPPSEDLARLCDNALNARGDPYERDRLHGRFGRIGSV